MFKFLVVLFAVMMLSYTISAQDGCVYSSKQESKSFKSSNLQLDGNYPCLAYTYVTQSVTVVINSTKNTTVSICKQSIDGKYLSLQEIIRTVAGQTVTQTIPLGMGGVNAPLTICTKDEAHLINELDMTFYS